MEPISSIAKAGIASAGAAAIVFTSSVTPPPPPAVPAVPARSANFMLTSASLPTPFALPSSAFFAPAGVVAPPAPVTALAAVSAPNSPVAPNLRTPTAAQGPVVGTQSAGSSISDGINTVYQGIQYWVDYGVQLAQWGLGFVPWVGGFASAQVGFFYWDLIRPIANSFVYNVVDTLFSNPANIGGALGTFARDSVNAAINFGWNELNYFIPLPPLPPLPGAVTSLATIQQGLLKSAQLKLIPANATLRQALKPLLDAMQKSQLKLAEALGLPAVKATDVVGKQPAAVEKVNGLVRLPAPGTKAPSSTDAIKSTDTTVKAPLVSKLLPDAAPAPKTSITESPTGTPFKGILRGPITGSRNTANPDKSAALPSGPTTNESTGGTTGKPDTTVKKPLKSVVDHVKSALGGGKNDSKPADS